YLIRSSNLFTIEPDVGAKIDAIEMQPNVLIAIVGRQLKFSPVPPGNAEGAIFRHRPQREVCADWITATRHQSQIHADEGIRVHLVIYQSSDDCGRNSRRIPTLRLELILRDSIAFLMDFGGRLNGPV